ncbi:Zinc finger CCCH domain-containing protein 2 [Apostasia shenzhenica]|uniref:Zinc finger CCCH domain-containing protein 2 n=1 Tax=Apostasia shenzhenica TaxID=1088818 RepID=A0A2I0B7A6_9ASPA|nr:Zinc finger CCCH domain-containing protein 2 [Apostasia shenzhenica]
MTENLLFPVSRKRMQHCDRNSAKEYVEISRSIRHVSSNGPPWAPPHHPHACRNFPMRHVSHHQSPKSPTDCPSFPPPISNGVNSSNHGLSTLPEFKLTTVNFVTPIRFIFSLHLRLPSGEIMMMGEGTSRNPAVHVPSWSPFDDQATSMGFPLQVSGAGDYLLNEAGLAALAALQRYLPANEAAEAEAEGEYLAELADPPVDAYSCDEFRMYEFKVRRCARGRAHDWTECPYAHPGEKARRRDPRKHHYSGTACPDFRRGGCKRGEACEFAHGVFESWLHPARYRTQPCKDGTACRRRVCFFAHTPEQLRVLPPQQQSPRAPESYDGSPLRHNALDGYFHKGLISSSPTSTLVSPPASPPRDSPPASPSAVGVRRASWPAGSAVNEVAASLRKLRLSKVSSMPSSWGGFCSPPPTPSRPATASGRGGSFLDLDGFPEEEVHVERVESGRALRAKMFERLSKETGLGRYGGEPAGAASPDVGWVSELVK